MARLQLCIHEAALIVAMVLLLGEVSTGQVINTASGSKRVLSARPSATRLLKSKDIGRMSSISNSDMRRYAFLASVPKFPGLYGVEAMANLSEWRQSFFKRTMAQQTRYLQDADAHSKKRENQGEGPNWMKYSFDLWKPFLSCPQDMPLEPILGDEGRDASKWTCSVRNLASPCIIYSLGSFNENSFEDYMLNATRCSIHTFDCTVDGASRGERSYFHKVCIGKKPSHAPAEAVYKSLTEVQAMLGHTHVHLMKMDIEGFEYDAVEDWKATDNLPEQLVMEYHYNLPMRHNVKTVNSIGDMGVFMLHLAQLGYGVIGAEINFNTRGQCAEMGFLRVESKHMIHRSMTAA